MKPTRRAVVLGGTVALMGCVASPPKRPVPPGFDRLAGWADADHGAALDVFRGSLHRARPSGDVTAADWASVSAEVKSASGEPIDIIERLFHPVSIDTGGRALFTGYYEPEIAGARTRHGPYQTPIYARPPELTRRQYFSRQQIVEGAIAGRGLELFWLADPVEAFFLQIQGSGRIRLAEGGTARVGYAGKNNHGYHPIGRSLVDRGIMTLDQVSGDSIKAWLRANPVAGEALMNENRSYVFFEPKPELDHSDGPIGALGIPLTPRISAAVDPAYHPLGAMLWVETDAAGFPGNLMVAQDVGGAIKGAQRADLFTGTGDAAGKEAGDLKASGRIFTLVPKVTARRISALGA